MLCLRFPLGFHVDLVRALGDLRVHSMLLGNALEGPAGILGTQGGLRGSFVILWDALGALKVEG